MSEREPATIKCWLAEPMPADVSVMIERLRRADDVCRVAVMPDVHLAKEVCVGTVIATRRLLYPGAVGGDIGCGMLAVAFDAEADVLADPARAGRLLCALSSAVPATRRHRSRTIAYPQQLAGMHLSHGSLDAVSRSQGVLQMGTLGGGNHFIELQSDEAGRLWLMIHSGSRVMGQAVREYHVSRAATVGAGLRALDAGTEGGRAYLHDLEWSRRFADANRRAMAEVVAQCIESECVARVMPETLVTCDHNHVAREEHFGEPLLVHRKGAMPAATGVAGVLPGSMGTLSYHVEGRGCEESLRSSAHGAGRAYSREQARRRVTARALSRQMGSVWFDYRIADSLRDEAPASYKDVRAVLRAQHDLVRVVRALRPLLSYKSP